LHKICITPPVVLCSLHVPKIIELCQGIQMLQAKTSVGTHFSWATLYIPTLRQQYPT